MTLPQKIWLAFATLNPDEDQRPTNSRIRAWTADPERAQYFREKEGLAMFEFNIVESPADSLASIAISLKRIADALTCQPGMDLNLFDYMREIATNTQGSP